MGAPDKIRREMEKGENIINNYDVFSSEINSLLDAVKESQETALKYGKEYFTWEEVGECLKKAGLSTYNAYYWFRVMMFGRNAEKMTDNGPTNRYPGSKAEDDTGNFISTDFPEKITNKNYKKTPLQITDKTKNTISL
ncbi:hypothetical protein CSB07_00100 [Candidatus Gracilibacteria bacterium]|nr:MAG: hypothetical protein CSB07_00100 [Candidatus Gracilibacteria bacterium]PIE85678.1 MAG: hypothetical protein CSA08_00845 [Candidatus Gracilibacteria bacterium]